jgi:acylphosphatase
MAAARYLVSGKVQGVWFRAGTREQAVALGLRGYARNLPDGRVEVLACGEAAAVERFVAWVWEGSPASKVTGVETSDAAAAEGERPGFTSG